MGFLPDLLSQTVLRSILLWSLYVNLLFSPEYNWPSDYLTRTTGCTISFSFLTGFTTVCDNACDLSVANKLPVFDYIIVGSGAAGSLLAYRLALANINRKVLLIEAGGDPIIESVPPPLFVFNLNNSAAYTYNAAVSPNYGNAYKSGVGCNCGRSTGGSTEMNAMMFVCGCDENYNSWATASGDASWNYANILPYIKKSHSVQDSTGSLLAGNCANYQGTSGPLIVSNSDSSSDYITPILKSATMELNYPQKNSANCGPPFTGFANIPMSIYNGQRESAARAFLVPLNNRANLYFMRNSTVTKVITAKDSTGAWGATGVRVITNCTKCPTINLSASREVIITAGSYNSPLILQRSGIGKAADLNACNITQVKDLPVGKNLSDHVLLMSYWTMPGFLPDNFTASTFFTNEAAKYLLNYSGYFSRIQGLNYGGFINTLNSAANCPDVQILVSRYEQNNPDIDLMMNDKWGYKKEYADQIVNATKNYAVIQVMTAVLQPQSRGTVSLGSCTDPYAKPNIDGNYFNVTADLDTLVRGMQAVCNIFSTNAARNAGINPLIFNITECNSLSFCSDSYIRCYAKYFTMNLWHPTGTNKMGTSAADSVVDNRLRVFGVKRLRVADASIMPSITAGNTQCPTYTIAEKAADMILADNP
ncbi:glucose dehydrogenase [FAD, quinone]-like [Chironomus tepperi]|uniref:glucose dehydrogenase [FAD, quinone]-like n=1 Tax=Chironomus tepperi TaxID=113505 RepID=UPI00391F189D